MKEPVYLQTLKGVKRLRKVSLGKRQELADLLSYIYITITEYPENISFAELYDKDPFFREGCNEAITLVGWDVDEIDIDTLYALLLPHIDGDNKPHNNGIIAQLNFGSVEGHPKNDHGEDASFADIMAILWSITGSLEEALNVLYDDRVTSELLMKAMDKYAQLRNPEEYGKSKAKAKAREYIMNQTNTHYETEEVSWDAYSR